MSLSCSREEFQIDNLSNNQIAIFGHGGMGVDHTYPLNTFESISNCLNLGANGSEMDVQITKDSVLVAFHDYDLGERTTIEGVINSLDWDEIKNASYIHPTYLNYRIVSLDDLFSNIADLHKYKFTFDCKLYSEYLSDTELHSIYSNALIKLITTFNLGNNVFIESNSVDFLKQLKLKDNTLPLFIYRDYFEEGMEIALDYDLYGITISTKNITRAQIEIVHNEGLFVAIWNVLSTDDNVEAIKKNPDFIQTDKLKNLIRLLK